MSLLEEKLPCSIQRQSCWAWVFFFLVTPNFMFQRGNSFTKFLKCYRTNRVLSQGKFKTHQRIRYKMRASFLQDKTPSDDILGFRATGS